MLFLHSFSCEETATKSRVRCRGIPCWADSSMGQHQSYSGGYISRMTRCGIQTAELTNWRCMTPCGQSLVGVDAHHTIMGTGQQWTPRIMCLCYHQLLVLVAKVQPTIVCVRMAYEDTCSEQPWPFFLCRVWTTRLLSDIAIHEQNILSAL